jgi:hypothetical protein
MAIGAVRGNVVSTEDLEKDQVVSVDRERFTVTAIRFHGGFWFVDLEPFIGPTWTLQVSDEDYTEPMWELA